MRRCFESGRVIDCEVNPTRRIYPVPIKPASDIGNWNGWPEDVRDTIRAWNKGRGLTFVRGGIFKCEGCEEFCESHEHGRAELRGVPYCDDCLIEKARTDPKAGEVWRMTLDDQTWRGGGAMSRRGRERTE